MNYKIANALTNDTLSLIIFPTEQCNFRCFYCYESFELGRMSPKTVEAILKLVKKRASTLKQLNISWFGGEPLMAKDIVLYLSKEFKKLSKKFNFIYNGSMTTNAYYLTDKLLKTLVDLGINTYQITLDGSKEFHDKIRIMKNRKGSFDTIWNNLLSFKKIDASFDVMIRVHYSPVTITDIKNFAPLLVETFEKDKRFSLLFRNVSKLGGKNDKILSTCTNNETQEYQMELSLLAKNFNKNVNIVSIESDYICYASKANSYIIRSDGSIGKCTVALKEDVNNIGKLKDNGELELDHDKFRLWSIGLQTENPNHLACPYHSLIEPAIVNEYAVLS